MPTNDKTHRPPRARRPHDDEPLELEDEVDELAPIDVEDREALHDAGDPADDIDFTPDASSDDATSSDLPIGDDEVFDDAPESLRGRSHVGPPSGKEPASIDHVDDDHAFDEGERAGDDWEPHREAASLGLDLADEIDDDDARDADDGGVEGTNEDIAAEVDESALPDLDADAGAGFEVDDLMRELTASGFGRESSEPGWVLREGWQRSGAFADVTAESGRVVAVGAEIVELAAGDAALRSVSTGAPLPASAACVALHRSGLVVAVGGALLSIDRAGATERPLVLFDAHRPIRSLAIVAGRVWAIAGDALWVVASPPATPQRARESGAKCVAAAAEELFLLAAERSELRLSRFRGDDGDWQTLSTWSLEQDPSRPRVLASSRSGAALAFADRDTLWHSWDRGATWASLEIQGLLAFTHRSVDGRDEIVVLRREDDAGEGGTRAALASVGSPLETSALRAVELPCAEPSLDAAIEGGGPISMAWCDARETLFVASPHGLVAVGPLRTH